MNKLQRFGAVALATALTFSLAACGDDDDAAEVDTPAGETGDTGNTGDTGDTGGGGEHPELAALTGQRIGVQSSTTGAAFAEDNKPEGAEIVAFEDTVGLFGAMESGDIVAILQDLPVNAYRTIEDGSVHVVETYETDEQYGFAVAKGSELKAELDGALATLRENGVYAELYEKYFPEDGNAGPGPEDSTVSGSRTITVCSDIPYPPMEMEGPGPRGLDYTGFDIDLLDHMVAELDADLEVLAVPWDGILGNLASGTCDVVASSVTITEERALQVDFTDPYFDAHQSLLVKK